MKNLKKEFMEILQKMKIRLTKYITKTTKH